MSDSSEHNESSTCNNSKYNLGDSYPEWWLGASQNDC